MEDQDQELVALIDNELDKDRKSRLLVRLEEDAALRARYEALRDAGAPIRGAFDALLERAPVARLRDAVPAESATRRAPRLLTGMAFRGLAAALCSASLLPPRLHGSRSVSRTVARTTIGARRLWITWISTRTTLLSS